MDIRIKGRRMFGYISSPADKYADTPDMPEDFQLERKYEWMHNYLEEKGNLLESELLVIPFIQEGIISESAVLHAYDLSPYLAIISYEPCGLFSGQNAISAYVACDRNYRDWMDNRLNEITSRGFIFNEKWYDLKPSEINLDLKILKENFLK